MNVLLAPNGKPSNLTPEQYKLVRLPAFKEWFGDWENDSENASKVVDENGEPLICYHGAEVSYNERFYLFNKGSYFTDNFNSARYYSLKLAYGIEDVKEENTTIYECFLSIKKPKTFDYKNEDAEILFHDFDENDKRIKEYESNGYDGIIWEYDYVMYDFRSSMSEKDWNNFIKTWENNPLKQKQDIDDFWKIKETKKENHFIIFNPTQIKLADGSNTTFDEKNPDIRFDGGGQIKTSKDEYGNWIGTYSNMNFKLFNLSEGWTYTIYFYSPIMESQKMYSSQEDREPFRTKKLAIDDITEKITEIKNENENFIKKRQSKNPDIRFDEGGGVKQDFKYSLTFGGITIYTNIEQEYIGKNYSPFESKGSFKADIRKSDLDNIAIESEQLKDFNFQWGVDDWKSISQKLKNKRINKLELYLTNGIIKTYELKVLNDSDNPDMSYAEGGLIAPSGKPRKDKFGDTIFEDVWLLTGNEYANESINVHSGDSLNRKKTQLQDYMQKNITNVQHKNRVQKAINENKYENAIQNGWITKERANEIIKSAELDITFSDDNHTKWNVDRYREVEKEMFELRKQGKVDSLEYFKLIKERSILEQAKMNPSSDSENSFAKGGKVVVLPADIQKYKKIGIEDKYFIEASKDVGLQGINFDSNSILKRIESQFNDMLDNYESYLINEDSPSITNYINNEIETHKEQGSSLETIQRLEQMKDNETSRRSVIEDIAKTQNESLEKWVDYLRLSEYKLPFKFMILKAVLNFNYDLKQNKLFERGRDTIRNFTPFDAGSLAELNEKNSDFLLMDYNVIMNENSSRILNSQEVVEQSGNGKWIKFNGGSKTKPEDIEKNGNRLMNLVQNTYWCTKSAGTSQLRGGDFYVYVTEANGEIFPRIAVRMNEDKVGEVRGNKSSAQDLDAEMLPIAEEFLNKNIPNDSGKKWLDSIKYNKKCVEMRKRFEAEGMYKDFIYDYIKLIADKDKYKVDYGANGNVTLLEQKFEEIIQVPNEYYQKDDIVTDYRLLSSSTNYYIGDIGNYELSRINSKFSHLTKLKLISGNLSLVSNDEVTDLGNIEYVGGDVSLTNQFTNENTRLGKLKYIGGTLNFNFANVESLNNLESVGGILVLKRITKDLGKLKKVGGLVINSCDDNFSLGMLEEIEGDLQILNSSVDINFGNLKTIGGSLFANDTIITDLKNLESVGKDFFIQRSKIKKFENLKTIGGDADFSNNFCSSTQNIESILGNVLFLNSRIMDFPKLNKIGGLINFKGSYFKSFGNIKYIGGNLNFSESKVEELGNLEYVGGFVSFKGSKIKNLNKLKKVVGFANFDGSIVEDLGDLESVGGNIYLNLTKIKSLGKLNYVGGLVMMKKDNYKFSDINYDLISEQLKK